MNELLLNPRLPDEDRKAYEDAWSFWVENRFTDHVGIATSGSTGVRGSLVLLSRTALETSARAVNERLKADDSAIWFKTLPDFHVGGLGIRLRAQLSGACIVEERFSKWDAKEFHSALSNAHATHLSLVPTQLFDLVQLGLRSPANLKALVIGGGRLEETLRLRARELGWPVLPSYGLTECCSQVATAMTPDDPRLVPLSHVTVDSALGKIAVRSPSLLTARIVFRPDGTSEVDDPKRRGWFVTDDLGSIEADGSLKIEGRAGDFVKIGGEGVSLARLEEKLESLKLRFGFQGQFVLLAARDERLGAKIIAVVSSTAGHESLLNAFNDAVAPFERIREVHVLGEIPRSPLGKPLRAQALKLVGLEPAPNL